MRIFNFDFIIIILNILHLCAFNECKNKIVQLKIRFQNKLESLSFITKFNRSSLKGKIYHEKTLINTLKFLNHIKISPTLTLTFILTFITPPIKPKIESLMIN